MKFKVCQFDDETSARKGKLKINGKTIDTPTLWIGHTIGGKPEPWKSFPVDNLLVNAYEILKKPSVFGEINKKGIHKYLDFDGLVLMDSGGFLFQKKNDIDVDASTILQLYHDSDPDIGVILDHPFDLSKSRRINNRRWKVTINNTIYMFENNGVSVLMPVLHGYNLDKIKKACKDIKKITNTPKLISMGSLVPLLFRTKGMGKIGNGMQFIIDAITHVRNEFPESFLHVFGVGSTTSMYLMFSLGVDSVDSMGWRLKAAYGWVQIPDIGVRYLKANNTRKSGNRRIISNGEKDCLYNCNCPICSPLSKKDQIQKLESSFRDRAIHNAWVFLQEEKEYREKIKSGYLHDFVKSRLNKSPFIKGFNYMDLNAK